MLPQTCKHRDVVGGEFAELQHNLHVAAGIIGVDAGNLVGMSGGPGIFKFTAATHADERGLAGKSALGGEKIIPGVPGFIRAQSGAGLNIRDAKTAPDQFHFGLRLMVPIAAAPLTHGWPGAAFFGTTRDATCR